MKTAQCKTVVWLALLGVFGSAHALTCGGGGSQPEEAGTQADPYEIGTVEEFYWLTQNGASTIKGSEVYIEQTADIDAQPIADCDPADGWKSPFLSGIYDGQGYTISNLVAYPSADDANAAALFGRLVYNVGDGGVDEIKNLTLSNFSIGDTETRNTGGFLASLGFNNQNTAKLTNLKLDGGIIKNTDSAGNVGGIIGEKVGNLAGTVEISGVVVEGTTLDSVFGTNSRTIGGVVAGVGAVDSFTLTDARVDATFNFYESTAQTQIGGLIGLFEGNGTDKPAGSISGAYVKLRYSDGGRAEYNPGAGAIEVDVFGSGTGNSNVSAMDFTCGDVSDIYIERDVTVTAATGGCGGSTTETQIHSTGFYKQELSATDVQDKTKFSLDFYSDPGNLTGAWDINADPQINNAEPYLKFEFPDPEVTVELSSAPTEANLTVTPSGPVTVALLATQDFTISVNEGYSIQINEASSCPGTLTNGTFTTEALIEDCTLVVGATEKTSEVTVDTSSAPAEANLEVTDPSTLPVTVSYDASQDFLLSVDDGFLIQVDEGASTCSGELIGSTFTATAVVEDCTIALGAAPVAASNEGDGPSADEGSVEASTNELVPQPVNTLSPLGFFWLSVLCLAFGLFAHSRGGLSGRFS